MHAHTSEASQCSQISAELLVDFYKKAGYTGLVITDHFFNGNTAVPKDLPWKERVDLFTKGYENALKRGKEVGLDVFFGFEISMLGTDFLIYDIDKNWLLEHEDCDKMRVGDFCDIVHESGGFVVQAHPFRELSYIEMIRLIPRKVDAVEIINSCNTDFENRMADNYADNYSLHKFCGSDNHIGMRPLLASLDLDFRAGNIHDIISAVIENKHKIKFYDVTENNGILLSERNLF